jgi:type VI secretion system protein VasD
MRVYQLKTDSSFARAEFFNLFDDDRKALGADLIARDEYELIPGEGRTLELAPSGDAQFLGAVAAFHDVRNSTWRAVLAVPKTGLGNSRINVIAAKTSIRIELGH